MRNSIYFAEWRGPASQGPRLRTGYRFDAAGRFLPPEGGTSGPPGGALPAGDDGILLDDRNPPSPAGAQAAARALGGFSGPIVCDFERPPSPAAEALIRLLAGCEVVVPELYAHLPHSAVLVGPYRPGVGFRRWLDEKKTRYGRVVLDGAEIFCRVRAGRPAEEAPEGAATEGAGLPCPGALCRCRREGDEFVFFDIPETLRERAMAANCPVILSN